MGPAPGRLLTGSAPGPPSHPPNTAPVWTTVLVPQGPPASNLPSAQLHHKTPRLGCPWGATLSRTAQHSCSAGHRRQLFTHQPSTCPVAPVHRFIRHAGSSPCTCLAVSTAWATPSSQSPGPLAGSVAQPPRPSQHFLWTGPRDPGAEEQTPGSCSHDPPAQGELTLASREVRCG